MSSHNLENLSYSNSPIIPNVSSEMDFRINNDSIYQSLNNDQLMTIEEIMKLRKEMLEEKDNLIHLTEKERECETKLEMYCVTEDEINEIKHINDIVVSGKDKLLNCLKQYNACSESISLIEIKIKDIIDASFTVNQNLRRLFEIHPDFLELSNNLVENLWDKKNELIEELQSELGVTCIARDRLGAIIMSLAKTYHILRNVPYNHICPICLTNEVDIYLEPCGHTLCNSCNRSDFCHMCRTRVKTSKGIFYS
jgi:hypothetical protein